MSARFHLWRLRDAVLDSVFGTARRQRIFEDIYRRNAWGSTESRSGQGSTLALTAGIREALPALWADLGVRSFLDAPCGDFAWMQRIVHHLEDYTGLDIARPVIDGNQRFASERVRFRVGDVTSDPLPKVDMILCRDCFIHLPTRLIKDALANFRSSGSTWMLVTHNPGVAYRDVPIGSWRKVDLTAPPFLLPEPEWSVADSSPGRRLALWRIGT